MICIVWGCVRETLLKINRVILCIFYHVLIGTIKDLSLSYVRV